LDGDLVKRNEKVKAVWLYTGRK